MAPRGLRGQPVRPHPRLHSSPPDAHRVCRGAPAPVTRDSSCIWHTGHLPRALGLPPGGLEAGRRWVVTVAPAWTPGGAACSVHRAVCPAEGQGLPRAGLGGWRWGGGAAGGPALAGSLLRVGRANGLHVGGIYWGMERRAWQVFPTGAGPSAGRG